MKERKAKLEIHSVKNLYYKITTKTQAFGGTYKTRKVFKLQVK